MTTLDKIILAAIAVITVVLAIFLPFSNSADQNISVEEEGAVPVVSFSDAVANPLVEDSGNSPQVQAVPNQADDSGANITFSDNSQSDTAQQSQNQPEASEVNSEANDGTVNNVATIIDTPNASEQATGLWYINAAQFNQSPNAAQMQKHIKSFGYNPKINQLQKNDSTFYRVELGPYQDKESAVKASEKLKADIGFPGRLFQK